MKCLIYLHQSGKYIFSIALCLVSMYDSNATHLHSTQVRIVFFFFFWKYLSYDTLNMKPEGTYTAHALL